MRQSPTGRNILNPVERAYFHRMGGQGMKGLELNKPVHREPRARPESATGGFGITKHNKKGNHK